MRRAVTILLVSVAMALVSCHQRDLYFGSTEPHVVNVMFDWDADTASLPAGMTMLFTSLDDGTVWRFDVAGHRGGPVEIPGGTYSLRAFNNDLPDVMLSPADGTGNPLLKVNATSQGALKPSGILYTAFIDRIEVLPCKVVYNKPDGTVKECGNSIVRCRPQLRSVTYRIAADSIAGAPRIRTAMATLTGVAPELDPATGKALGAPTAVSFGMTTAGDSLTATATALGPVGWTGTQYILTVRAVLFDGATLERQFDVTGQVMASTDPMQVWIRLDGVNLPAPPDPPVPPDVALGVDIDGWTIVDITITTDKV